MYEFDFQLNQKDLIKYQIAHIYSDARTHLLYLLISFLLIIYIVFRSISMSSYDIATGLEHISWLWVMFWFVVIYISALIACAFFIFPYVLLKSDYLALAPTHIKVTENQFFIQNQFTQSSYFWYPKQKIIDRLGNVMIYVSPNLPFLIPKRAFQSRQQRLEFVVFCKKLIAE